MPAHIAYNQEQLAAFCRKWQVRELALFGSVLRDDFRPDSDVDVLVTFFPDSSASYWDWSEMTDELKTIFGREIDLVPRGGLRNPFRRHEILRTAETVYAA